MPVAVLVHLRHIYRDHHHHHHHHHYCSLYLCNDQKIWITTKIHIFTKGFKHIECGRFLRDHAGFHEHNEPRVVWYKLWHDLINSHKVTKHACTFSCLPLATQCTTYSMTLQLWTNNKTNKSYKQLIYIYINISCKCDTNRAGHLTLDAYASRPVACRYILCSQDRDLWNRIRIMFELIRGLSFTMWWWGFVCNGSVNGLLPDGYKPLPEPMSIYYQ